MPDESLSDSKKPRHYPGFSTHLGDRLCHDSRKLDDGASASSYDTSHSCETITDSLPVVTVNRPITQSIAKMSAEVEVKLEDFKSIFSLSGKVAVVTGGSRGLGLHAASG